MLSLSVAISSCFICVDPLCDHDFHIHKIMLIINYFFVVIHFLTHWLFNKQQSYATSNVWGIPFEGLLLGMWL